METKDSFLRAGLWVVLALAVLHLTTVGIRPLYDPDESRYGEIPREMLATGDWIVPHLNYVNYLEKPPLAYWITALGYKIFGVGEWPARLPNAAYYLATCVMIFWWGKFSFGRSAAFRASWMYATALLPLLLGRFLTLDFALTFFLSAALFLIGRAETGRGGTKSILAGWLCAGLATLVKGPVAVVFCVAAVLAYRASNRIWPIRAESRVAGPPMKWHTAGLILAAAVCLPWFYAMSRRVPEFLRFFIIDQHFRRFGGAEHAAPFWFYVPVLIVGFFPWTWSFLKTFIPSRFKISFNDPVLRWCWLWAGVVLALFTASGGKLVPYVLPLFAPMMLIMAAELDEKIGRETVRAAAGVFILLAIVLAIVSVPPRYEEALDWGRAPLSVLFAVGAAIALWLDRMDGKKAIYIPAIVLVLFALFLEIGGSDPDAHRTAYPFRRQLQAAQVPIISYGDYFQSLNFYSGRRVIVANNFGELAFGAKFPGTSSWFWTEAQVSDLIDSDSPALMLMKMDTFRRSFQSRPQIRLVDQAASIVLASVNGAAHTSYGGEKIR